jgi:hypothetical protein
LIPPAPEAVWSSLSSLNQVTVPPLAIVTTAGRISWSLCSSTVTCLASGPPVDSSSSDPLLARTNGCCCGWARGASAVVAVTAPASAGLMVMTMTIPRYDEFPASRASR